MRRGQKGKRLKRERENSPRPTDNFFPSSPFPLLTFSPFFDAHLAQCARRVAPIFFDLDEEFEIDAVADQALDVAARLGADLFEARAAAAYDDAFLRGALDIDGAEDAR